MDKISHVVSVTVLLILFIAPERTGAQFIDSFEQNEIHPAWQWFSGDGQAEISFVKKNNHASVLVDATNDIMNLWWAVIKRQVEGLDVAKLSGPGYELRVEAKIKTSHAPRRINLHFNHQRTTDFHLHLKEFDIADTSQWHVISMTTKDFDAKPGDKINVQLALMDWGLQTYEVKIDYIRVDVVDPEKTDPDLGNPQDYHPEIPSINTFSHALHVVEDAMVDKKYTNKNFNNWSDAFRSNAVNLLPVSHEQIVLMKFDTEDYKNHVPKGISVLAMNVHHLEQSPDFKKDFGMVRLVEILDGDYNWKQEEVTYASFLQGGLPEEVFNGQMIIDLDLNNIENKTACFTLSEAVMKRLLNGRTKGLAIVPLGAVHASFYGSETQTNELRPTLYFNEK